MCGRLAQGRSLAMWRPGTEPATRCLQFQRRNHYANEPQLALNSMVVSFVCGQNELSTVMSFPKNENWKIVKNVVDENLSQ